MISQQPEVTPFYTTEEINQTIHLSQEQVIITLENDKSFPTDAEFYLRFLPAPEIFIESTRDSWPPDHGEPTGLKLTRTGSLTSVRLRLIDGNRIVVAPTNDAVSVLEPPSPTIHKVLFHTINFTELISKTPDVASDGDKHTRIDKQELTANGWRIVLSHVVNTRGSFKAFHDALGYAITHAGSIERTDNQDFSAADVRDVIAGLRQFLSFASGSRTDLILPLGYDKSGQKVWERWDAGHADLWRSSLSWFNSWHAHILSEVFPGFWTKRCDSRWKQPIEEAIYWYLLANDPSRGLDAGVILAQAALEMLAFVYVCDEIKLFSRKNFDRLRASDKLRHLLQNLGIPTAIPADLVQVSSLSAWTDGPHALTTFRNDIVHANRAFAAPSTVIYWQFWNLGLWYLELVLLRLFDHNGEYTNRTDFNRTANKVDLVPWV